MSERTTKEILAHNEQIGGSRWISYGGMELLAPIRDIRDSMDFLNSVDRRRVMASVNAALANNFPKVANRTASQKVAMQTAHDVAIWFANEVIEGRAAIEVH
jgi:hypothetical protein